MKKINLIYWNNDNFGDALSPLLIAELSGMQIQYKNIELSISDRMRILWKSFISLRFENLKTIIFPWENTVVGIGSVIGWGNDRSSVWGAGFMNNFSPFKGGKIFAVRGKLTEQKLIDLGCPTNSVYGDPALLLPLWIPEPLVSQTKNIGIIPHWKEVDEFIALYGDRYLIIDLRTRDIKDVIDKICSCKYILSTSLHGLIVSHAYKVPALWIKKNYIDTDGFKFHDYFSSVDIPSYEGFENIEQILGVETVLETFFEENRDKALINNSLEKIQIALLKSAPFPLKKKYEDVRNCLEESARRS
ncbi:polysaccharide pyruvyl transferase family protein [Sphingobacterium sp. LRF_L2]|uniref:polysaccharide pyruvyl transferase family protein n=1 Tax=Sphingobacterium sp. LRF_L2 TaxID=3369421 RepID=UPI003F618512